jgi:hypothetical protein
VRFASQPACSSHTAPNAAPANDPKPCRPTYTLVAKHFERRGIPPACTPYSPTWTTLSPPTTIQADRPAQCQCNSENLGTTVANILILVGVVALTVITIISLLERFSDRQSGPCHELSQEDQVKLGAIAFRVRRKSQAERLQQWIVEYRWQAEWDGATEGPSTVVVAPVEGQDGNGESAASPSTAIRCPVETTHSSKNDDGADEHKDEDDEEYSAWAPRQEGEAVAKYLLD